MLPLSDGGNYTYSICSLSLEIHLDKSMSVRDTYSCFLYNDELMLLNNLSSGDNGVKTAGKTICAQFEQERLWIPGRYFLIMRSRKGKILRFDITLDENRQFVVDDPVECPPMSDEDMLSGRLCQHINPWKNLSNTPGMLQMKKWAVERAKQNELNSLRSDHAVPKIDFCNNLLLATRSAKAGYCVTMLKAVLELADRIKFGDCSEFYDASSTASTCSNLKDFFESEYSSDNPLDMELPDLKRSLYCFSNFELLPDSVCGMVVSEIVSRWAEPDVHVVFRGTKSELDNLLERYPFLKDRFPLNNRLEEMPYSLMEMLYIFFSILKRQNLRLSAAATDKMCHMIVEAYQRGDISHWITGNIRQYVEKELKPRYCRNVIDDIRKTHNRESLREVESNDIEECRFATKVNYKDTLDELNGMVGLNDIKQTIATLANRLHFYNERQRLGLQTSRDAVCHAIFTGNPGTGKTTVAKLMGRIYHSLGLLSRGDVICVDRKKIIGQYIGQTEDNMKNILRAAHGNVLFVDEAYTLYTGESKDFGRNAIECLQEVLSQKNPDMMVIFAGYEKEMDKMMSMNAGLLGRFPYKFQFKDYSAEELMQIAEKILRKDQYLLTDDASRQMLKSIREAVENHTEHFSNARWVEQYVKNGIIPAMADRLSSQSCAKGSIDYQLIDAADVRRAYEAYNPMSSGIRRRRAVGFC